MIPLPPNPKVSALFAALLWTIPQLAAAHDGPDATITHRHNEVRSQPDATTDWHDAEVGEVLYQQGRVNTLERSGATILFRDQGNVAMRQNTLLIVYGHHATHRKKEIAMDAELERGSLRARLGELDGSPSLTAIATPGATTFLEGGNSLLKVDDEGTSRVHNHGDGEAEVRAKRGGRTKVKKGMGVKVKKAKTASKPVPLPATPTWVAGPQIFLSVSGHISKLDGSWAEVSEASNYFIEVASDEPGVNVLSAIEVPSDVRDFEVHGLLPGSYHVRVASVNGDEFESIPSQARAIDLVGISLEGPGGAAAFWPEDGGLTPVPRVLPGTAVVLPEGIRCGATPETLEARPLLIEPGVHTLSCARDDGAVVIAFPIEVPQLGPSLREQAGSEGSDAAAASALEAGTETGSETDASAETDASTETDAGSETGVENPSTEPETEGPESFVLTRGQAITRAFALDTELELPAEIYLSGPEGIEVQSVTQGEEPGTWLVTLLATESAPTEGELGLSFLDPAVAEIPPFATLALTVVEPPAAPAELPPERHMVELGLAGGLVLLAKDHALFNAAAAAHQPFNRPAGQFVIRAGYYPIRWVGIELAGRVIPTTLENSESALVYSVRAQVLGQLPYRVTPFITVGGELLGISSKPVALGSETDFGAHVGGGLKVYLSSKLALRGGATAMFHDGLGDPLTTHVEIDLGISVVLGRRSAKRLR